MQDQTARVHPTDIKAAVWSRLARPWWCDMGREAPYFLGQIKDTSLGLGFLKDVTVHFLVHSEYQGLHSRDRIYYYRGLFITLCDYGHGYRYRVITQRPALVVASHKTQTMQKALEEASRLVEQTLSEVLACSVTVGPADPLFDVYVKIV